MIEKKSPSQILSLGGTYTVLPNKSIALMKNPLTLGVWTYFVSKPPRWGINQKNVCERFNISVRQYYKIIKELKSINLCREYTKRDSRKLLGKVVVIVSSTDDWSDAEKRLDDIGKNGGYYLTFPANTYRLGLESSEPVNPSNINDSCELNGFVNFTKRQTHNSCTLRFVTTHNCDTSQNAKHSNNRDKEIKENNKASSNSGFSQERQIDTNSKNTLLAAADFSIGHDLTANQRQYITSQLNTLAMDSHNAKDGLFSGMGLQEVSELVGKAILDTNQFKRCKTFEHKLHSILGEITKGNFNRIVADVCSAGNAEKTSSSRVHNITPAQKLQDTIRRLQNECACQQQALTGPMAQYPDFVSATKACIAKLNEDIAAKESELKALLNTDSQVEDRGADILPLPPLDSAPHLSAAKSAQGVRS